MFALVLSVLLLNLPANTRADVIALLNGDRVTGTVTTIAEGQVQITTEHFGDLTIPMAQVAGIDQVAPMNLLVNGSAVMGVLTMDGGRQVVRTDVGTQPVSLLSVAQVPPANPPPEWTTNVDFGYVMSKGNSETESGSLHLDSNLVSGVTEHRVFAYWNRDEADSELTRDTFDAGYDFRWYFRDSWYALANLGYFKDKLKNIDQRITVGAGVGYQFFNTDVASLSTELGMTQVFEDLNGDNESNPAVRWAVDYKRWLSPDRIDYFYGHEVLKILDSDRGEIYKANTGVRLHLSDLWTAHARVDLIHETKPPAGSKKTDTVYSVGVGLVF